MSELGKLQGAGEAIRVLFIVTAFHLCQ